MKWWVATSPGADSAWGTADDTISGLRELHLDQNAAIGAIAWHSTPGADSAWDTKDDVVDTGTRYEWNKSVLARIWTSNAAGPDGVIATADDPPSNLATFTNDANGHLLEQAFFGAAGADDKWLTADDVEQARTTYEFNTAGTEGLLRNYGSPGADGKWGTGDDVITSMARPKGKTYRVADAVVYYTQSGADTVWTTADGVIGGVLTVDCAKAVIRSYSSAGPDTTWQTSDDTIGSYQWLSGRAECLGVACAVLTGPN
ncbi:hypothetical protein BH09MYX1_BH09MYX1_22640 [soil metagenome]